jgi:hypothetical protein
LGKIFSLRFSIQEPAGQFQSNVYKSSSGKGNLSLFKSHGRKDKYKNAKIDWVISESSPQEALDQKRSNLQDSLLT